MKEEKKLTDAEMATSKIREELSYLRGDANAINRVLYFAVNSETCRDDVKTIQAIKSLIEERHKQALLGILHRARKGLGMTD